MNEPINSERSANQVVSAQTVMSRESAPIFDQERAALYDRQFEKLAPLRDALHLLMRLVMAKLPDNARILCIGVGTGLELLALAQAFPQWQFTALDPAPAMLDICRRKVEENGIASRCTFHEGYLDSLPSSEPFDAATCILVSHFLVQHEERCHFFRQIAERLRPAGILVSCDLASEMSSSDYRSLLEVWLRMLEYSEAPAEVIQKTVDSYGQNVALLPPSQVESIIASSGFDQPTLFFQALLVHAWYSRKAD
jgi:tRNA (cmo5U34)-methyltransferase